MIRGIEYHSIIKNIFNDVKGYGVSSQLQVDCPRCSEREGLLNGDGRKNLEINVSKHKFRCWKCSDPPFSGDLIKLLYQYGSKIDIELYKSYHIGGFGEYGYEYEEEDVDDVIIKLPYEMIHFSDMNSNNPDHLEAYNYLVLDRCISRELILKYKLGFCLTGRYAKRIIIPSYDRYGLINYFIGRNYDLKNTKRNPYDNVKANKDSIIFNEGYVNWDSTICLVEGVFEMFSFPVNTIPLLGKILSTALFKKINEIKPNVVILLDPDAYKDSIDLFQQLKSIYIGCENRIKIVKIPFEKDFDLLRKNRGIDVAIECLYSLEGLTINDNFMKKLMNEYSRGKSYGRSYSKDIEWRSGGTKQFLRGI